MLTVGSIGPGPLVLVSVVLALAALCWPSATAARRVSPGRVAVRPARGARLTALRRVTVPACALGGALVAGVGGACSAAALAGLAKRFWRTRRRSRSRRERSAALAAGLRLVVGELRAGAHPATAADEARRDGSGVVASAFREIAATARLGGDVPALLEAGNRFDPDLRDPLARLARCWRLAERHGVALADLVDAVRRDLDDQAEFAGEVEAKMAGPRSTAAVLSGLPVLGLLLGEAVGAGPIAVLTGGVAGQALLVTGTGLICAGVLWTVRLTESVVRT